MANRFEFVSRGIAPLVLLGVCCFSAPARALRVPLAELHNSSVPANGVLRFSVPEGATVRILFADGSEVPGSFVAPSVWRPDEPFVLGTYTADITWDEHPSWARDATFEVTEAIDPAAELVHVVVTSRVDADGDRVVDEMCCLDGQAQRSEPCDGACQPLSSPLCVATVYEAKHVVLVHAEPQGVEMEWQLETREVATMGEGEFTLGYWDVAGSPENLCGVVEVFSWLDESTTTVQNCVSNPKPELTPIAEPVAGFGVTPACTIPPPGYEELWCQERHYLCTVWLLTPEGSQNPDTLRACEHYGRTCEGSEDPTTPGGESTDDSALTSERGATEGSMSDETGDDGEPRLRGVESSKGCAMTAAPGVRVDWRVLLVAAGLGGVFLRRWVRR